MADADAMITYRHCNDTSPNPTRYRQYKRDKVPAWAADVQDEVIVTPTEPEAPCYYDHSEASAWQGGWTVGYEAGYEAGRKAGSQA